MNPNSSWLSLIISLPTRNSTVRMSIWRALKGLGCAILRDGVYLLPKSDASEDTLTNLANKTIKSGGHAHLLELISRNNEQDSAFKSLFERSEDYAKLSTEILEFQITLPTQDAHSILRIAIHLRKNFQAIADIDFFPGEAKDKIQSALLEVEKNVAALTLTSIHEPGAQSGSIQTLDTADYQGRTWATRKHLWVDRMASAWLIRNFIDKKASFIWLDSPQNCPNNALGFDFDYAPFTHIGNRVTYEVLLASFKLDHNIALNRIGALVHYLDVGGIPVAEASGLEMILKGTRNRCPDDDSLLTEASTLFNDLYLAYNKEETTHE